VSLGPQGVILADKAAGMTSHDVVASVRRELGRGVKVGHAGTLDPFATGLLLVLVGRATRTARFFLGLPKRYLVTARFGAVSSTGDPEGKIEVTGRIPQGPLELPVGRFPQRPPAYSAVKIGGRRAYALARTGRPVEPEAREVEVQRFEQLWHEDDRRGFEIVCSSGTYVRSLIAGLGDAYCEALRRTAIGGFEVEQADVRRVVPLAEALAFMPDVDLPAEAAQRVAHGGRVAAPGPVPAARRPVRLTHAGELIAIAEPREDELHPVVVLAPRV
jgi:tRNA pseudouridine55 synthase